MNPSQDSGGPIITMKSMYKYIRSTIGISRNLLSNIVKLSISLPARVEVNYRLANQSDYYSSNLWTLVLVSVCEVVSRDGTTIGNVIDVVAMVMEKL